MPASKGMKDAGSSPLIAYMSCMRDVLNESVAAMLGCRCAFVDDLCRLGALPAGRDVDRVCSCSKRQGMRPELSRRRRLDRRDELNSAGPRPAPLVPPPLLLEQTCDPDVPARKPSLDNHQRKGSSGIFAPHRTGDDHTSHNNTRSLSFPNPQHFCAHVQGGRLTSRGASATLRAVAFRPDRF